MDDPHELLLRDMAKTRLMRAILPRCWPAITRRAITRLISSAMIMLQESFVLNPSAAVARARQSNGTTSLQVRLEKRSV